MEKNLATTGASPEERSRAAAALGSARTPAKAEAARENGAKGGRPKGQKSSPEAREKMKAAWAARKAAALATNPQKETAE